MTIRHTRRSVFEHHRLVLGLATHLLGDREEALDLSQEVFLRVFRTLHRFRGQSSLRTWIFRIVVNQVRNRQRWWRRRQRSNQVSLDEHIRDHGEMVLGAEASTPDRELTRKEMGARFKTAIQNLPFEQRTALVLREIEGLRYEEIAFSLGLPIGTVKSRLTRARQALREEWETCDADLELRTCSGRALRVLRRRATGARPHRDIADHIDGCASCRLEADDLEAIGGALQATARVEDVAVMPGLGRLQTDMLERWDAEEKASLGRTITDVFDDRATDVGVRRCLGGRVAVHSDERVRARAESHPASGVAESRDDAQLARSHHGHLPSVGRTSTRLRLRRRDYAGDCREWS